MTATATTSSPFATALQVPRWALGFYLRHLPWIAGISLLPAAERVAFQLWHERLPDTLNVPLEILVWVIRAFLVVLIYRVAISGDPRLQELDPQIRSARPGAFLRTRRASFAIQMALLACAFLVFSVPEWFVAFLPAAYEDAYMAALLGVKNPTVIAFSMIWVVGIVRQMLLTPGSNERGAG